MVFATISCAILYPAFVAFGVIFLSEGKTATGIALLVCVAVGFPSLISWRRKFR